MFRTRNAAKALALTLVAGALQVPVLAVSAEAAAPSAQPAASGSHRVVRGVYRLLTRDVPGPDGRTHDELRRVLELPNGRWVDLHVPSTVTASYNSPVEIRGVGDEHRLDVQSARPLRGEEARSAYPVASLDGAAGAAATTSSQPTTGTTSVLVILAYWGAKDSVTPASAANVVFGQGNPWWKEASYGALAITGRVTEWVRISAPTDCYGDSDAIMSRARSAASAYNPAAYQRTIVYFPSCGGSPGWAYVGAGSVWINGSLDQRVVIHEQGHNYGLGHAHSYGCTSAGKAVTLGASCTSVEYGDPYDAMGGGSYVGHFSGRHKDRLGWLGSARRTVLTSGAPATLTPYETASGLKAAVVNVSSTRAYWLEHRTATGKDKGFPAGALGVQVRLVTSAIGDGGPLLLDARPADGNPYDPFESVTLPAGSSWTTPEGIRISVGTVTASGAQFTALGGAGPPTSPTAPTGVTAKAGDLNAALTWVKPTSDNGALITSYVVTASPGGRKLTVESVGGGTTAGTMTGLANGTAYTFTVIATNSAGTSDPSAPSLPVTPTAAVPSVSVTSPPGGAVLTADRAPLTVSTAPSPISGAPIAYVSYLLDGEYVATGETAPFGATLDLTYVPTGAHTLVAQAYDRNGRMGTSAPISLSYAPPVPAVTITSPAAGAVLSDRTVPVSLTATPGSPSHPLESVHATLADGSYAGSAVRQGTSDTWVFDWDITGLQDGASYLLTAYATDDQGRTAASPPVSVTVQHATPTVVVTGPAADPPVFGLGTVTAQVGRSLVTDPEVASLQVVADGVTLLGTLYSGDPAAEASGAWAVAVDWRVLANGPHTLTAKATNLDGYATTTPAHTVTVANPAPTAALVAPTDGATLVGIVTVQATALPDPGPGAAAVTSVAFVVDGMLTGYLVDDAGTWSGDWDTRYAEQGSHSLSLLVQDAAGYSGTSAGLTVVLDNPGPTVALTSPGPDEVLSGTVSLTASAAPSVATSTALYYVEYQVDGNAVAYAYPTAEGTWATSFDATWLAPGPHTVLARVTDEDGITRSSPAVQVMSIAPPDPPAGLFTTVGQTSVTLEWTPPASTGGAPLTGYRIEQLDSSYTVVASHDVGPDVLSHTLSGLTGDSVNVQLRSLGPAGPSAYPIGPYLLDLAPAPVTGLTLRGNDRSITLAWTPSAATDVSSVDIYVGPGTGTPDVYSYPDRSVDASATGTTLTGLAGGTAYTVAVVVRDYSGNTTPVGATTLPGTALTTAAPATVVYGGAVNVTAKLVRAGTTTPLAGRAVTLRQKRRGTATWTVVGRFVTASTGVATARRIPTTNTDFLWTLEGVPGEMGTSGPVRVTSVQSKVALTLSASRVALGRYVAANGTVAPNHRGQRIYLQQRIGTSWRNVTSALLSSSSSVRFTITGRTRGTQYYRLYKPADSDHVAGYSAVRTLAVV